MTATSLFIKENKWKRKMWISSPTSIAPTKYSDRIDIQAVITESQISVSHLEISGDSSSFELFPFWLSSWIHIMLPQTDEQICYAKPLQEMW